MKLKGSFGSPFWEVLVIQASLTEPSIFHAMLALSSVHKRITEGLDELPLELEPERLEKFTLRAYNRSINHLLQHKFASKDKASVRVVLISCMLFTCLEFLRGRFKTGNDHLRSGMKLLAGLRKKELGVGPCTLLGRGSNREPTDDLLIEAFTRMNLQAMQFGQGYRTSSNTGFPKSEACSPYRPPFITFESISRARNELDNLINEIFHLTERRRQREICENSRDSIAEEVPHDFQRSLSSALSAWLNAYNASHINFQAQLNPHSKVGHQMLFLYHTMATILADTTLRSDNEMAFDSHTDNFFLMIHHASKILEIVRTFHNLNNPVYRSGSELCLFSADIGWTLPLYYTALHCRIQSIRHQAIKLLRVLPSREGIWDSMFAAFVAENVVRIEEGNLYEDAPLGNDFLDHQPQKFDMSTPMLPASRRVHDVQVVLPNSPLWKTVLTCKRRKTHGDYEVITKEYDFKP